MAYGQTKPRLPEQLTGKNLVRTGHNQDHRQKPIADTVRIARSSEMLISEAPTTDPGTVQSSVQGCDQGGGCYV